MLGLRFEAFGDIEKIANDPPSTPDQEHRIRPVALFETELGDWRGAGTGLGSLSGPADATRDNTVKFNLEYERRPAAEAADDD
ncbi:MAG TPA: hypothetical protein VHK05_10780 [Candidatus Limnocylindrales bacterium]|nr:hypothetical protein [Candidatus Limnocylindrales bacterium]